MGGVSLFIPVFLLCICAVPVFGFIYHYNYYKIKKIRRQIENFQGLSEDYGVLVQQEEDLKKQSSIALKIAFLAGATGIILGWLTLLNLYWSSSGQGS